MLPPEFAKHWLGPDHPAFGAFDERHDLAVPNLGELFGPGLQTRMPFAALRTFRHGLEDRSIIPAAAAAASNLLPSMRTFRRGRTNSSDDDPKLLCLRPPDGRPTKGREPANLKDRRQLCRSTATLDSGRWAQLLQGANLFSPSVLLFSVAARYHRIRIIVVPRGVSMPNFDQPEYDHLRKIVSERTKSFVFWLGAGISVSAGLPSWSALRDRLIKAAENRAKTFDESEQERRLRKLHAARSQNPWLAFDIIARQLGPEVYRTEIRHALAPASSTRIPSAFGKIWKLRPSAVLTLSIDRLASRSLLESKYSSKGFSEFSSNQPGKFSTAIELPHPFIANLHGDHEDSDSWVFRRTDLKRLLEDQAYRSFIIRVLSNRTVIFAGITLEDLAVGGLLEDLRKQGLKTGPHYWFTHRNDPSLDAWAQSIGVEVIRYASVGNDHSELDLFLEDLYSHIPTDTLAPPVAPSIGDQPLVAGALPAPSEAFRESPENLRWMLNNAASLILSSNSNADVRYREFLEQYQHAIYAASFVSTTPPNNTVFGVQLEAEIGKGGFGKVFRASDSSGRTVALKLLHRESSENREMLEAFRRGVRSMQILNDSSTKGVVKFISAWELPPAMLMEFVPGPNLKEAVDAKQLTDWSDRLEVAFQLVKIIRSGHKHAQRVLHRDIRPPNIMLENLYADGKINIKVLDFDLSWHQDAEGRTIALNPGINGYLAPEQLSSASNSSTRHAGVDTYGVGMTLFFLCAQRDPSPGESLRVSWPITVSEAVKRHKSDRWHSLPSRFARMILVSTREKQSDRWDLSQLELELERLIVAEKSPETLRPLPDMLAEELAVRALPHDTYVWNENTFTAEFRMINGSRVFLTGAPFDDCVEASLEWLDTGNADRRNIGKFVAARKEQAVTALEKSGWNIRSANADSSQTQITARASAVFIKTDIERFAVGLGKASEFFRKE